MNKYLISPASITIDSVSSGTFGVYKEVVCATYFSYCFFFGGDLVIPSQGIVRFDSTLGANDPAAFVRITPDYFSLTADSVLKPDTTIALYGKNYKRIVDLSIVANPPVLLDVTTSKNERTYAYSADTLDYLVGEQVFFFSKYVTQDNSLVSTINIIPLGAPRYIARVKILNSSQFAIIGTSDGFVAVDYDEMVMVANEDTNPYIWNTAFVTLPNRNKMIFNTEYN